jgi:hypothetical protein
MNAQFYLAAICSFAGVLNAQTQDEKVLALFEKHCVDCHYEDEEPDLHDTIDLAALKANTKYVVLGNPESSELFYRVTLPDQTKGRMPKSRGNAGEKRYREPLDDGDVSLLREWIQGDAPEIKAPEPQSLESSVRDIFQKHCAECHEEDESPELHGGVSLAALLRDPDFVSPRDASGSLLFKRIDLPDSSRQRMPKSRGSVGNPGYRPSLSPEEKTVIKQWIDTGGGAVSQDRPVISPADVVQVVHDDLQKTASRDQSYLRYFSLRNLHQLKGVKGEAAEDDSLLLAYRAGVSKLINSLSRAPQVVVPKVLDPSKVVLRIDLRDYGWSRDDWERLVAGYPFAIEGLNGRQERAIARMSGSGRAWLRGDWFVFAASQPPLYHDLLKLPHSEPALEQQMGVSTLENLRNHEAIRAGFRDSGVSNANRLIERHVLPSYRGAYWKSYDFSPLRARLTDDLFNAPLGPLSAGLTQDPSLAFTHDGGEIIFHLPNGLQGYYLATADGKRLNRAPSDIVHDENRSDGVILNGISCIACHSDGMNFPPGRGLETVRDEVGVVGVERAGSFRERKTVEALYSDAETLRREMDRDQRQFFAAVQSAYGPYADVHEPVLLLYRHFNQPVDLARMAAEFGDTPEALLKRMRESDDPGIIVLAAQLERGLPIPRQTWLQQWERLCEALDFPLRAYKLIPYEEFGGASEEVLAVNVGHALPTVAEVGSAAPPVSARANLPGGGVLRAKLAQGVVKVGNALDVRFSVTRESFVRVVHFGADGSTTQMFPNKFQANARVPANRETQILGPETGVEWATSGQIGPEHIVFVASESPFADGSAASRFGGGEVVRTVAPETVYTRGRLALRPRTLTVSGGLAKSVSVRLGVLLVD